MTRIFRSPSTYVQGRNAVAAIGEHAPTDGSHAVVVADPAVRNIVGDPIRTGLEAAGLTVESVDFDGLCTRGEIDRVAGLAEGTDLVVGAGGGRRAIARECFRTVDDHGESALAAVERDAVTDSVEAVVEAATLLSGIGFESGGLAAAHAVHDGLTRVEPTHDATHGEKVNIGTLTQLVLEGRDTEVVHDIVDLSVDLGLPVTLADIGLTDPTDEQLRTVAEAACEPQETIHNEPFDVTPDAVRDALVTADEMARTRRNNRENE